MPVSQRVLIITMGFVLIWMLGRSTRYVIDTSKGMKNGTVTKLRGGLIVGAWLLFMLVSGLLMRRYFLAHPPKIVIW